MLSISYCSAIENPIIIETSRVIYSNGRDSTLSKGDGPSYTGAYAQPVSGVVQKDSDIDEPDIDARYPTVPALYRTSEQSLYIGGEKPFKKRRCTKYYRFSKKPGILVESEDSSISTCRLSEVATPREPSTSRSPEAFNDNGMVSPSDRK